jgi:hypothetical protein
MTCANCGKDSGSADAWTPGWGCLYGCLAVCGLECAKEWAAACNSQWSELRPGDLEIASEDGLKTYDPLKGD